MEVYIQGYYFLCGRYERGNSYHMGDKRSEGMRLSASKAIRKKCLDCTCSQVVEIRECNIKTCPLWTWRMGYEVDDKGNKIIKRTLTEEAKNNLISRLHNR